jgi:hypothetical protein
VKSVLARAAAGDAVLTLGAGSISQVGPMVLQALREQGGG